MACEFSRVDAIGALAASRIFGSRRTALVVEIHAMETTVCAIQHTGRLVLGLAEMAMAKTAARCAQHCDFELAKLVPDMDSAACDYTLPPKAVAR